MKLRVGLLILCGLMPGPLASQEGHLVHNHISHGVFGGPMVRFTEVNGQFGVLAGGHAGWVIDRRFVIGGGGYGLIGTGIDAPYGGSPGVRPHLSLGYGGLELQYVDRPEHPVHFLVFLLAGGGSAGYHAGSNKQSDGVFVAEPGILITVHFTRSIHFDIGSTYRLVAGVNVPGLNDTSLSGFTGVAGFDFGHF